MKHRATFGIEQVTSQRCPRELALHEVVPIALPPMSLLLLVVLVTTFVSLSARVPLVVLVLVLVLVLLLLSTLMLLEVDAAPAPVATRQSDIASASGNLMVRLREPSRAASSWFD